MKRERAVVMIAAMIVILIQNNQNLKMDKEILQRQLMIIPVVQIQIMMSTFYQSKKKFKQSSIDFNKKRLKILKNVKEENYQSLMKKNKLLNFQNNKHLKFGKILLIICQMTITLSLEHSMMASLKDPKSIYAMVECQIVKCL